MSRIDFWLRQTVAMPGEGSYSLCGGESLDKDSEALVLFRYDFKPASVDASGRGKLKISDDGEGVEVEHPTSTGSEGDEPLRFVGQLAKQERECLILLKGDKAVVERAPETVRKLKFVRSQSQGTPTPGGAKRQSGAAKPPGSSKSKVAKASSRIIKE